MFSGMQDSCLFKKVINPADDFAEIALLVRLFVAALIICWVFGQLSSSSSSCLCFFFLVLFQASFFIILAAFIWLLCTFWMFDLVVAPHKGAAYKIVLFMRLAPTLLNCAVEM